jgi:hypothetical protein
MNAHWFPVLVHIALDYLPIQSSSVLCERAFLSRKQTATDQCRSLESNTFEAIQITKNNKQTQVKMVHQARRAGEKASREEQVRLGVSLVLEKLCAESGPIEID